MTFATPAHRNTIKQGLGLVPSVIREAPAGESAVRLLQAFGREIVPKLEEPSWIRGLMPLFLRRPYEVVTGLEMLEHTPAADAAPGFLAGFRELRSFLDDVEGEETLEVPPLIEITWNANDTLQLGLLRGGLKCVYGFSRPNTMQELGTVRGKGPALVQAIADARTSLGSILTEVAGEEDGRGRLSEVLAEDAAVCNAILSPLLSQVRNLSEDNHLEAHPLLILAMSVVKPIRGLQDLIDLIQKTALPWVLQRNSPPDTTQVKTSS